MSIAMHSTIKRSLTCVDLISMTSAETSDAYDSSASSEKANRVLKKRPSAIAGWDHYKADDDNSALLELQSWRNKKRSRRHVDTSSLIFMTARVKVPRHHGIAVWEDETRCHHTSRRQFIRIPSTIYCTPNVSSEDVFDGSGDAGEARASPAVHQMTHDFAMM